MSELRFEIGQKVWLATYESETDYVECPDCGGTGRIRCLLPDDSMVSVECAGCSRGFEGPTGRIQIYKRTPRARECVISGLEIRDGKTEWGTSLSYRVGDEDLFLDESNALKRAQDRAAASEREERERINQKEKDTRSWSWNVHYHRREIRDAERRLAYHKAKLAVANLKAKKSTPAKDDAA